MSTRRITVKSSRVQSRPTIDPADNVTGFPASSIQTSAAAWPEEFEDALDDAPVRPIDAIADHVLAARYISTEWHDRELNRLLDLVLLQIGRTIATLDGPVAHKILTH